jgi:hypothetical protein
MCLALQIRSQTSGNTISGKVSYISSQNVYVKFSSTYGINPGDTLYVLQKNDLVPVLIVNNLSSTSCVCRPIVNIDFSGLAQIIARKKDTASGQKKDIEIADAEANPTKEKIIIPGDTSLINVTNKQAISNQKHSIRGSISASTYSYYSHSSSLNSNRYQYNFSLNARNIANSKLSAESNISFRHEDSKWATVKDNIYQALKIYGLSLKYDVSKSMEICFGRRINYKLSSIGAIDGLQLEKRFKNFYVGIIVGSRPDYKDYSFDFTLPQVGAYVAHDIKSTAGAMQNSFAFVEQMNTSKTDRRFIYYQHSNSLAKNLYLYGTVEIDLYKKLNDKPENTFSLSSAYTSISYKMFKRLSISASYDNRKNVVYYETYKSFINQVLEIESRQGLSLQANYNTLMGISFGARGGYRFKNNNSGESRNIYGYLSFYNIPVVKMSATAAATYLKSDYISGNIYSISLSKDLLKGKFYTEAGYQYVKYGFFENETTLIQNIINLSVSWNIVRNLSFSFNFEEILEGNALNSRLNLQVRKRF